ncbi:MAG: hypothetical protein AMXMBFR64_38910 [Myxococcales bacterium]
MTLDLIAVVDRRRNQTLCSRVRARRIRRSRRASVVQERSRRDVRWAEAGGTLAGVERLATLGALAADVGHELNNVACVLLNAIEMTREAAAGGRPADPQDLEALDYACRHVVAHGRNLLRLGSPATSTGVTDLAEAAEATVKALQMTGRRRHAQVRVEVEGPLRVAMPRMHVEQVLMNLLLNALDAHEESRSQSPMVRVAAAARDGRVTCTVEDNGPGMCNEVAARAFDVYFTTKRDGRGTGLGLPLVRKMVEDAGGAVALWTREGAGTRITLDLPALAEQRR